MATKNGEILADATDKTGKIVGKGRIVKSGKLRQIGSSIFQVASIAVAQSHLADIEKSLTEIKSSLTAMKDFLESTELAKIEGAISYLTEIKMYIENSKNSTKLSKPKKNQIESINKDFLEWERKLFNDFNNLIKKINTQKDEDWFGTGDTYEKLRELSESELEPLIKRHHLLSQLAIIISYITSYIDPLEVEFTHVKLSKDWESKFSEYQNITNQVLECLLKDSLFNTSDTLRDRRKVIESIAYKNTTILREQQTSYIELKKVITSKVKNIYKDDISLALTFDQNGEVTKSAIIHSNF